MSEPRASSLFKEFYRVDEVAERWSLSTRTIYSLINMGDLPAYRIAGSYRIKAEDIKAYEEAHREDPLAAQ